MNNTEKSRAMPLTVPENREMTPQGHKPVAVRSYTMTRDRRDDWLGQNMNDCQRVCAPTEKEIKETKEKKPKKTSIKGTVLKYSISALAVIVLLGIIASVWIRSYNKQISTITVIGTERYSAIRLANAAGISIGSKVNGVENKANAQKILRKYTDLSACLIEVDKDGNVTIRVEEYEPVIYFELSGMYYSMTDDLLVIQSTDSSAVFADKGILLAKIPDAQVAICGKRLELEDGKTDYICEFLKEAEKNNLLEDLIEISFADRYSIETVSKNGNVVRYGSIEKIGEKIKIVERVESEQTTDAVLTIDVSQPEATHVKETTQNK